MEEALPDTQFTQHLCSTPKAPSNALITSTIHSLNLQPHPEGGHFAETDRDPFLIPNPFKLSDGSTGSAADNNCVRNASTTILYLLSPGSPIGHFHRNKARTVHTLHRGRGRYVLIHEDGRIETFVVGHDLERGEKLQWIVEGGKFKASYLLPDVEGGMESEGGLLISETVVPGFEFDDHDFLTTEGLKGLARKEQVGQLGWLLNENEREKLEGV